MKKKMVWGGLLLAAALMLAPAVTAEAKEVAAGESIPLTEEYFPDEWFLSRAKTYDKNADGFLSPEEVAAVTQIWCPYDLSDFSQLQYFTNLKKLKVDGDDGDSGCGVWLGNEELDLTVFPNLEEAYLYLDTGKMEDGSPAVQINVSGLERLRDLRIYDDGIPTKDSKYDGADARIDTIDLRDTPALENVRILDAKSVIFDDVTHIKSIYLSNMQIIPTEQIGGFTELQDLTIWTNVPEFSCMDVSKNNALKTLKLSNNYLREVRLAGADALEEVWIESDTLSDIDVSQNPNIKTLRLDCPKLGKLDVSQNPNIKSLRLDCPKLEKLDVSQNKKLQKLCLIGCTGLADLNVDGAVSLDNLFVRSDRLTELYLTSNTVLTDLSVCGNKIASLDVTKNTKLEILYIESKAIKKLNLKKNTKLTRLGIVCKQLASVDLSKNKKLQRLHIYSTLIKSIDLSNQKDLDYLNIRMKKLKSLDLLNLSSKGSLTTLEISDSAWKAIDLSEMTKLKKLTLENNKALSKLDLSKNIRLKELEIHGSPKLTKLDLRKNKRLFDVNVSGNGLKVLDLSGTKKYLTYLDCRDNQLTEIDLSGVSPSYHSAIYCDKNVKVKGYKGEVMH